VSFEILRKRKRWYVNVGYDTVKLMLQRILRGGKRKGKEEGEI
jgi:hypothetical protein